MYIDIFMLCSDPYCVEFYMDLNTAAMWDLAPCTQLHCGQYSPLSFFSRCIRVCWNMQMNLASTKEPAQFNSPILGTGEAQQVQ